MKHLLKSLLFNILLFPLITYGQTAKKEIHVHEGSEIIERISRDGFYVEIELDKATVEKAWDKKVREYGKTDLLKNYTVVKQANITSVCTNGNIYSSVSTSGKGTKVFWAIEDINGYVTSKHGNHQTAKKILEDFARQMYVEDINHQIAAAELALQQSAKVQEKTIKESEQISKNIEKNKQEKLDLDAAMLKNGENAKLLEQEKLNNIESQKAAAIEVEKMKKALEHVKGKLNQF
jgi:hypothetical protein